MTTDFEKLNGYTLIGALKLYDANLIDLEYVWVSEPKACMRCAALNGKVFKSLEEVPPRPHPNCKCKLEVRPKVRVESVSTEAEANKLVEKNKVSLFQEFKILLNNVKTLINDLDEIIESMDNQFSIFEEYLKFVDASKLSNEELMELKNFEKTYKVQMKELKLLKEQFPNLVNTNSIDYLYDNLKKLAKYHDDLVVFLATKKNSLIIGKYYGQIFNLPDSYNLLCIAANTPSAKTYIKGNGKLYNKIDELDCNYNKKDIKNRVNLESSLGDCKVLVLNETSSIAQKIIKSNGLFAFILSHKKELANKQQIISGEIIFESNDSDLYASFHSAGVKNCKLDNKGNLTLQVVDFYNFNEGRTSVKGRVGRKLQELGELEPYYIIVNVKVPRKMICYFFDM